MGLSNKKINISTTGDVYSTNYSTNLSNSKSLVCKYNYSNENNLIDKESTKYIDNIMLSNIYTNVNDLLGYNSRLPFNIIYNLFDEIDSLPANIFKNCQTLENVSQIPFNYTKIEHDAFNGCYNLKNINIHTNIIELEDSVFDGCKMLQSINASNLLKIGKRALAGTGIESISFNENIEYLSPFVFSDCYKLKSFSFENPLEVYEGAFAGCTSLTSVEIEQYKGVVSNNSDIIVKDYSEIINPDNPGGDEPGGNDNPGEDEPGGNDNPGGDEPGGNDNPGGDEPSQDPIDIPSGEEFNTMNLWTIYNCNIYELSNTVADKELYNIYFDPAPANINQYVYGYFSENDKNNENTIFNGKILFNATQWVLRKTDSAGRDLHILELRASGSRNLKIQNCDKNQIIYIKSNNTEFIDLEKCNNITLLKQNENEYYFKVNETGDIILQIIKYTQIKELSINKYIEFNHNNLEEDYKLDIYSLTQQYADKYQIYIQNYIDDHISQLPSDIYDYNNTLYVYGYINENDTAPIDGIGKIMFTNGSTWLLRKGHFLHSTNSGNRSLLIKDCNKNQIIYIKVHSNDNNYTLDLTTCDNITLLKQNETEYYFKVNETKNVILGTQKYIQIEQLSVNDYNINFGSNFVFGSSDEDIQISSKEILPNYIFASCKKLDVANNVSFIDNIKIIGVGSLMNCTSLKELYNDIRIINNYGFKDCINLNSIDLKNCEFIGNYAFKNCQSLKTVDINKLKSMDNTNVFENCVNLRNVVQSNSINKIGDKYFKNCKSLLSFDFSNIEEIGKQSFYCCESLGLINIIDNLDDEVIDFGGKNIYINTVTPNNQNNNENNEDNSINATYISGSDTINLINTDYNNDNNDNNIINQTTLDLLNVKDIDDYAFCGCSSITEVKLNSEVTLGEGVFMNCTSLKSIELPQSIYNFTYNLFNNCTSLRKIKFNSGISENIELSGLSNCNKINSIEIPNSDKYKVINNECIIDIESNTIIYVVKDLSILNITEEYGDNINIDDNAFNNCNLSIINISEDIKAPNINEKTFANIINNKFHVLISRNDSKYNKYINILGSNKIYYI